MDPFLQGQVSKETDYLTTDVRDLFSSLADWTGDT